jgi:acyl carrier protein
MDALKDALARLTARPPSALALVESTRLREDLGLDSFAAVELVFEVEDRFNLRIPQSAAMTFQTVADVVSYLSAELTKQNPGFAERPDNVIAP